MINFLLPFVTVALFVFFPFAAQALTKKMTDSKMELISEIPSIYRQVSSEQLRAMLHDKSPQMSDAVINKVTTALKCTNTYNVSRNNILAVIDYSMPSNEKRLWVFDLAKRQLLFNTYVSHGIKSGTLLTSFFSNKNNSKASSMGVYKTDQSYYGREGLSLRLEGLERNFNDNAKSRSIVMHGGWYMDEHFIQHYGRPGRSWGCPALPFSDYKGIINTIKDNALMVVYYPSDEWFGKSKFLTCEKTVSKSAATHIQEQQAFASENEQRDDVFFAQVSKGGEDKPILVMPASQYEKTFKAQVPLGRMLRRQIDNQEYIALNNAEINEMTLHNDSRAIDSMYFVIPTLKMSHGYYETVMKVVDLGRIKSIHPSGDNSGKVKNYTVHFDAKPAVRLQSTDRFIRWLGL